MRGEQTVLTPSQVGQYLKGLMDRDRLLSGLLVRGELSNYKMYPSGHHYFTLKDAGGACAASCFGGMRHLCASGPKTECRSLPRDGSPSFPGMDSISSTVSA